MKMPKFQKKDKRSELEKEIDDLIEKLRDADCDSPEYEKLMGKIANLQAIKDSKEPMDKKTKIDPNTILAGVFTIGQLLLIMNFEKVNVITTKAWSRIWRGRN